ncbi:MAG: crotonase/enoyl-CoA hydratase family protein [Pseudomonadota bacterium]
MNDRVKLAVENGIATVTLNRADKHNGMDFVMLDAVVDAQHRLKKRSDVRAAIIHGDGPSFCAGLDLKTVMADKKAALAGYAKLWSPVRNKFQTWSMGWRELPFPVIACIHGNCFGAGIQLALGADIRVATPDAKISVMEAKWGLIPDMGGAALLREAVGIDVAKELTFTARTISGDDALKLRLVTHVHSDPMTKARELIAEIVVRSPDAVAAGKFLMQHAWSSGESGALAGERRYQRQLMGGKNQRIAIERGMKKTETPFKPLKIRS